MQYSVLFVINTFKLCEEIIAFSLTDSLLRFKLVLDGCSTLSAHTLSVSGLLAEPTVVTAAGPCGPWAPTKLLLSHTATTSSGAELSTTIAGSLTAVILGMEVGAKLETVVGAAHKVSLAASMTVIGTAISRSITVTFAFITRVLWGATSFTIVISSRASLTCRRFKGNSWQRLRSRSGGQESFRKVTAVILLMIVETKLLAVVAATDKVSLTSLMSIISSTITGSITVSLSIPTWVLWSTTSPAVVVPAGTSLTLGWFSWWVSRWRQSLTKTRCEAHGQEYNNFHF